MTFVLLLIITMVAGDIFWWRWGDRRLRPRGRARLWRGILGTFMAIQLVFFIALIVGRVTRTQADLWPPKYLLAAIFLWHFIGLPVGLLIALSEAAARGVARLGPRPALPNRGDPDEPRGATRRDFLRIAGRGSPLATFIATGASLAQFDDFRIRRFDLAFPDLPAALRGMTIAQVTDVHIGRFTDDRVLRRIVEATNGLRADLVLLTGDLIDHSLSDLPAGLDAVRRMDGRFGVVMCEGNHDLFEGRAGFESAVKQSGVPLLINQTMKLNVRGHDVQLLGLKWGSPAATGPQRGDSAIAGSMRELVPQIDPGAFPILLAHHPHAFDPAAEAGIPLTLSGHTHGGQMMMSPHVGFGSLMFRYWSGLYEREKSKLIVSNGVGNWFPLRLNAPAEIVHITLHGKN